MNNQYQTLSMATDALKKKGYTLDFNLLPHSIECKSLKATFPPENFHIDEYHRFEGMSDPSDMAVLYAVTTDNGLKGTLVDAYGTYEDPMTAEMIQKMRI